MTLAIGELGENMRVAGVDIHALPLGARLSFGPAVLPPDIPAPPFCLEVTGLRNPCAQLDEKIRPGLLKACLVRDEQGSIVRRRSGVFTKVLCDFVITEGTTVRVHPPPLGGWAMPVPI